MMLRVALVVIAGAAVAATSAARVVAQTPSPDEKSYAELVAANYVVLSRAESVRLVRFATAFSSCLRSRLNCIGLTCATALGGPPRGASLQTMQRLGDTRAVVLYVPRRCLLDPKVASS